MTRVRSQYERKCFIEMNHRKALMRVERYWTHLQVSFDFIEDIFAASSEQYGTRLRVRALLEEREVPE